MSHILKSGTPRPSRRIANKGNRDIGSLSSAIAIFIPPTFENRTDHGPCGVPLTGLYIPCPFAPFFDHTPRSRGRSGAL